MDYGTVNDVSAGQRAAYVRQVVPASTVRWGDQTGLYVRPWGFRLEDIRTPVHLSHGEQDANAPVAMGRYLAAVIPDCQATFYPGEGHLHFVDRLPEIFAALSP